MTVGLTTSSTPTLTVDEVTTVTGLVDAAAAVDGYSALNEAAQLHLRHDRPGVLHVLATRSQQLVGYAQLDTEQAAGTAFSTGQLVVTPSARRSGVGATLLSELLRTSSLPVQIWAMGNSAAARALASSAGLVPARELLIMTRSLTDPVPEAPPAAGITLRPFVVGQDEEEWLQVNTEAFRHHPEQGQMTRGDLDERIAEDWFDPAGFFVAVTAAGPAATAKMVGFHWTKQHPDRLGEVYVLGVDPTSGGRGLGKVLLTRGLQHLRDRGNTVVQLYVEADHDRAVRLYTGYGFSVSSRDVMYAQRHQIPSAGQG